jgi:SAM-dependent methyltransferase
MFMISSTKQAQYTKRMQISSGLRSVLAFPWIYSLSMRLLRNEANRRWFIDEVLALRDGQKLVDIGCGPADILDCLPAVKYIGLDISERYIEAARQKYGDRGVFLAGRLAHWANDSRTRDADVVLANGVLHHVDDDEARQMLEFARAILKQDGRFVFYEPCYLIWQSKSSRYFMSRDRGRNIRTEQGWKDLAASVFPQFSTNIVTGVNRLFYVCIIGQCHQL